MLGEGEERPGGEEGKEGYHLWSQTWALAGKCTSSSQESHNASIRRVASTRRLKSAPPSPEEQKKLYKLLLLAQLVLLFTLCSIPMCGP